MRNNLPRNNWGGARGKKKLTCRRRSAQVESWVVHLCPPWGGTGRKTQPRGMGGMPRRSAPRVSCGDTRRRLGP